MGGPADAQFTEFMVGCWPRLPRLGYVLTGDRGLAEDVARRGHEAGDVGRLDTQSAADSGRRAGV